MSTDLDPSQDWLDALKWNDDGLIPAIAQDAESGRVLMLAWMNRESLARTAQTGKAVYWSRSRGRLWQKGEESGHVQHVRAMRADCDGDAILLFVQQDGLACHTGRESCFFFAREGEHWQAAAPVLKDPGEIYAARADASPMRDLPLEAGASATKQASSDSGEDVLSRLCATLSARRQADPETSYTAKLLSRGPDAILKKIGEETAELIMASKTAQTADIIYEAGDVFFHILVLLAFHGLSIDDIRQELARREGVSGIAEKKARSGRDQGSGGVKK